MVCAQQAPPYTPITPAQRLKWFALASAGPVNLLGGGVVSSAWGTMRNEPVEYGPHWEGFGRRFGLRASGVATSNAIEALGGAALGEDPRYFRLGQAASPGRRIRHILSAAFTARRADGSTRFSYSRLAGNIGGNYASNLWRPDSQTGAGDTALRCVWGVTGRMAGNAFAEFMPDFLRRKPRK